MSIVISASNMQWERNAEDQCEEVFIGKGGLAQFTYPRRVEWADNTVSLLQQSTEIVFMDAQEGAPEHALRPQQRFSSKKTFQSKLSRFLVNITTLNVKPLK